MTIRMRKNSLQNNFVWENWKSRTQTERTGRLCIDEENALRSQFRRISKEFSSGILAIKISPILQHQLIYCQRRISLIKPTRQRQLNLWLKVISKTLSTRPEGFQDHRKDREREKMKNWENFSVHQCVSVVRERAPIFELSLRSSTANVQLFPDHRPCKKWVRSNSEKLEVKVWKLKTERKNQFDILKQYFD